MSDSSAYQKHISTKENLPQVIILYGPAGSGKGTQAEYLEKLLPSYSHLDFGTELRQFVNDHLGQEAQKSNSTIKAIQINEEPKNDFERAVRIHRRISNAETAFAVDLRYVIEKTLIQKIHAGVGMIIEGPGRMIEEAQWLSHFFAENKTTVCMFHLHLTLEDIIPRLANRYFVPGNPHPYSSYDLALADCPPHVTPYKRQDDADVNLVVNRYRTMYKKIFARILFIYQLHARTQIFIIDASRSIEDVASDIKHILTSYYHF